MSERMTAKEFRDMLAGVQAAGGRVTSDKGVLRIREPRGKRAKEESSTPVEPPFSILECRKRIKITNPASYGWLILLCTIFIELCILTIVKR